MKLVQILATSGPLIGQLNILKGLQKLISDHPILSNIPADERADPWNMSGPIITTLVIGNDPVVYGRDASEFDSVQNDIDRWSGELLSRIQRLLVTIGVRTFSFAQFGVGSTATLGKEIGILTSSAFFLLALILWFNFRSKRETAYVMVLTIFAMQQLMEYRDG